MILTSPLGNNCGLHVIGSVMQQCIVVYPLVVFFLLKLCVIVVLVEAVLLKAKESSSLALRDVAGTLTLLSISKWKDSPLEVKRQIIEPNA